ncbi:MAG: ATP-binding cassette domain-containing protein [Clostridia bacterium]|nr:ATP-binding cassette domain-containing protein [Clostridia bacterium]
MIEFKNVYKNYGQNRALKGISFKAESGDILGFLGPNGAGKSTALNILTGYLSATSGEAYVDGVSIFENPVEAKKNIGFLPELPPLYPDMKVGEYLGFVYDLKGCKLPKKQHIKEICEVVQISDVYGRLIKNLSKGYKQRVGIAQALIGNPKVLVFDEPTVGLDPKQIIEIRNLVKELGKEHTIIFSSHILPEIQQICSRVVVINEGVIVADESIESLAEAVEGPRRLIAKICGPEAEVLKILRALPAIKSADAIGKVDSDSISYLIESDERIDARKPLFAALAAKGYPLIGLEGVEMSLEDVFVRLTSKRDQRRRGR